MKRAVKSWPRSRDREVDGVDALPSGVESTGGGELDARQVQGQRRDLVRLRPPQSLRESRGCVPRETALGGTGRPADVLPDKQPHQPAAQEATRQSRAEDCEEAKRDLSERVQEEDPRPADLEAARRCRGRLAGLGEWTGAQDGQGHGSWPRR